MQRPRFRMQDYDLLTHNCNNFTNECSLFLLGKAIPQDIIDLPNRALSTPLGQMIRPAIEQYQQQMVQQYAPIDQTIGGGARAATANPHSHLNVPLFSLAAPIPHDSGALSAPIDRLKQLLSGQVLPQSVAGLAGQSIAGVAALAQGPLDVLVGDLCKLVKGLAEENRYPVWDLLRVAALNEKCSFDSHILAEVLAATTKLSQIAALRLVQNILLRPSPLIAAPVDVATAKFLAKGIENEQIGVRKAACMAAYNFVCARSSQEASVVLVSAAGHAIKGRRDAPDSLEALSYILCLGTAAYGVPSICSAIISLQLDLTQYRQSANAQVAMATSQLEAILNA